MMAEIEHTSERSGQMSGGLARLGDDGRNVTGEIISAHFSGRCGLFR